MPIPDGVLLEAQLLLTLLNYNIIRIDWFYINVIEKKTIFQGVEDFVANRTQLKARFVCRIVSLFFRQKGFIDSNDNKRCHHLFHSLQGYFCADHHTYDIHLDNIFGTKCINISIFLSPTSMHFLHP